MPGAASPGSASPAVTEVSTAGCGAGGPCRAQEAAVLPRELLESWLEQDSWAGRLSGLVIGTGRAKQILHTSVLQAGLVAAAGTSNVLSLCPT